MPTVYRIEPDVNHFQKLEYDEWPAEDAVWNTEKAFFEGTPISGLWEPPDIYVRSPMLKIPNIWPGPALTFSLDEQSLHVLGPIVGQCGEMLPIRFEGRALYAVNITSVVDCIDMELSDYNELTCWFQKYAFREERFQRTLFKIPQTTAGEVLTVEGVWDPEREFKPLVEKHRLSGLLFRPLWSNDDV
jgi:hypothetical protein